MASKIFLDANILLDFFLKRELYASAKQLIEKTIQGQVRAYISPSIVHIVGYWLTKTYGNAKAKELLLTLLADIQIIEIDHETAIHALHSKITDIEDALQYYTAMHYKLDAFISQDKQLQKVASGILPVYTPDNFLKTLNG